VDELDPRKPIFKERVNTQDALVQLQLVPWPRE